MMTLDGILATGSIPGWLESDLCLTSKRLDYNENTRSDPTPRLKGRRFHFFKIQTEHIPGLSL